MPRRIISSMTKYSKSIERRSLEIKDAGSKDRILGSNGPELRVWYMHEELHSTTIYHDPRTAGSLGIGHRSDKSLWEVDYENSTSCSFSSYIFQSIIHRISFLILVIFSVPCTALSVSREATSSFFNGWRRGVKLMYDEYLFRHDECLISILGIYSALREMTEYLLPCSSHFFVGQDFC